MDDSDYIVEEDPDYKPEEEKLSDSTPEEPEEEKGFTEKISDKVTEGFKDVMDFFKNWFQ